MAQRPCDVTIGLVPINALVVAKSRLRPVLTDADRIALVAWLGRRVVAALRDSGAVDRVIVASPEERVLELFAGNAAVLPVRTAGGNLNADLKRGRRQARTLGARRLLIALGDLPLLDTATVRGLVATLDSTASGDRPAVVLAPDRAGTGTNLMLLQPADAIPLMFGNQSLPRHIEMAAYVGIEPHLYRSEATAYDVDTPADLDELIARGLWRPGNLTPTPLP